MTTTFALPIDNDIQDRLAKLSGERGASPEDVAAYALLLGLALLESGLDEEEAVRALREPGTGLDIPLLMAKRRSRGQFMDANDLAALAGDGSPFVVHWQDDPGLFEDGEDDG